MRLKQVDLCEQSLGAAARRGHASSACTAAKQVGLFQWETVAVTKVSIPFAKMMRPPSDMLSGPAADLTVENLVSGLRFCHSSAEPERSSPTHFQSKMNVCVNMKECAAET